MSKDFKSSIPKNATFDISDTAQHILIPIDDIRFEVRKRRTKYTKYEEEEESPVLPLRAVTHTPQSRDNRLIVFIFFVIICYILYDRLYWH